jgi:hypothetical protein
MDSSQCSLILVTAEALNNGDSALRLLQATFAQGLKVPPMANA